MPLRKQVMGWHCIWHTYITSIWHTWLLYMTHLITVYDTPDYRCKLAQELLKSHYYKTGPIFYSCPGRVSANERRCYICDRARHQPVRKDIIYVTPTLIGWRACSSMDRKRVLVSRSHFIRLVTCYGVNMSIVCRWTTVDTCALVLHSI